MAAQRMQCGLQGEEKILAVQSRPVRDSEGKISWGTGGSSRARREAQLFYNVQDAIKNDVMRPYTLSEARRIGMPLAVSSMFRAPRGQKLSLNGAWSLSILEAIPTS